MRKSTYIIFLNIFLFFNCTDSDKVFAAETTGTEHIYSPSQMTELKTILKGKLKPGDIVYLEDGTYPDFQIVFTGNGDPIAPITLKAKNPGNVLITGDISIKIGGTFLVVEGLVLKDGKAANGNDIIEFRSSSINLAYNCRLTNTVIDNCNNPDDSYRTSTNKSERWVMLYGKNNRVDHCYFTNKINGGVLLMVNLSAEESRENNHLIDYNFFSNRPVFTPGNNAEIIRLGDSHTSQESCNTTVENNFFYNCDGEVEIISLKSCENTIRKNVFYESEGNVVLRHGNRNIIESNAFIGNNKKNMGGVRVINQGHKIYNNYFQDLEGTGNCSALCVMTGVFEKPANNTDKEKEPLNAYHKVKDVEICYNTFVNCRNIDLGKVSTYKYPPTNLYFPGKIVKGTLKPKCIIANNIFYNSSQETIINRIDSNDEFITCLNNLYRFETALSLKGLERRNLLFENSNGIYRLKNTDNTILCIDTPHTNFSYVDDDITGNTRNEKKDAGCYQFANRNLSFVAKPSECGVNWYPLLKTEQNKITSKTQF